jgi:urease accessory protein
MKSCKTLLTATTLVLLSPLALAHPGHASDNAFLSGILHPLTGLDHLLVLCGLGLLAGLLQGRQRLLMLAGLSTGVLAGAVAGVLVPSAAALESLVTLSMLALPLMLISGRKASVGQTLALVAALLFSLAHGAVQGSETAEWSAVAGLWLASSLLLLTGALLGKQLQLRWQQA